MPALLACQAFFGFCHKNNGFFNMIKCTIFGGWIALKYKFIKNAMILTATSLILRTVGIFFRIYLSNKIGPEGMGLYQLVFSIYILAATLPTCGISTAVTRLVTEELVSGSRHSVQKILRRSLILTLGVSLICTAAVLFGANFIAEKFIKDSRAALSIKILSLSLPFMGVSSCIKGYFIARRKAEKPSGAQLFEQFVRIITIVFFINLFSQKGLAFVCAAILIGDTIAETASCVHLYILYKKDSRTLPGALHSRPSYRITPRLLKIALPIAGSHYLNSLLRTIENLLVPNCLERYTGSKEISLSQFGMLKGMALPILFFPASFLTAMSTLLVPEISEARSRKQTLRVESTVNRTMQITLTSSILIAGIFLILGPKIGKLVYGEEQVGYLIRALSLIVPFMYLESVASGILRGLDQQLQSFKYSIIDSSLRILLIFFMVPPMGMYGFLIIMVISNVLTSVLNIRRMLKVTGVKLKLVKWIISPTIAVITAGAITAMLFRPIISRGILTFTILSGLSISVLYFAFLFLTKTLTKQDIKP